jgi:hypothetical protein
MRLCAQHKDTISALAIYEWMRSPATVGGAALQPNVFTYTVAMRAALNSGMLDKSMQVRTAVGMSGGGCGCERRGDNGCEG